MSEWPDAEVVNFYDDRDILEVSVAGGDPMLMSGLGVRLILLPVFVLRVFAKAEGDA